ncbi:protein spire isoform X2 [Nilaparvata lugens]|uniref:protein spire isoform X2 n=1 Tax=Nilaparvata lugens TaxID=108931 RepID=UPI00193D3B3E|nr:protein spire isoform X2 [Nilaparvata lugens]
MSEDVEVKPRKCILDKNECVSLLDILISFNAPISEEHAWALCFQCAKCFKNTFSSDRTRFRVVEDLDQVLIHRDGHVHHTTVLPGSGPPSNEGTSRNGPLSEQKVIISLGCVVFRALDFGLDEEEERHLHPDLEALIANMSTSSGVDRVGGGSTTETDDEGIERDACEGEGDYDHHSSPSSLHHFSLDDVLKICSAHVGESGPGQADNHYRAVCRALVAEALELSTFLEKVSQGTKDLRDKADSCVSADLDNLNFSDWARLWVQVIRELRHGVQLKKVCYSRRPIEYELTPYEILMDDIRSRRYKLNKVMVDGNIPHRVKKDAHAIILEFIRSRPPLKKASERKLGPKVCQVASPRELLLESIKQGQVKLRPASILKRSEFRASLKKVVPVGNADDSPDPLSPPQKNTRRLIKVDFSALQTDDEDDDDEDDEDVDCGGGGGGGDRKQSQGGGKRHPWHRTGTSTTLTHDEYHRYCDTALESYDLATQCPSRRASMRRHTIVVCEPAAKSGSLSVPQSRPASRQTASTPSDDSLGCTLPEMSWSRSSLQDDLLQSKQWQEECLALTLEEIVHIRSVLTKAELESLPVEGHVKEDAEKRKVCFLCMKTRFSIFGPWGQICKLCKRTVCSKCYSKMRIPTEHFAHVPVVALSPSLISPDEDNFPKSLMSKLMVPELSRSGVGSAPASPKHSRSTPPSQMSTSLISDIGPQSLPPPSPAYTPTGIRGKFIRSKTLGRPTDKAEKMKGLQMIVCHDCKTMVIQIIKSSRTTRNNAIRNLTLDLSPVYSTA